MFTYCFEYIRQTDFFAIMYACKHSTTRHEYGWNIKTSCSNQHTRYYFIAVWNEHHSIKRCCHSCCFDGISDDITSYQGVFHTDVVHRQAVTNTNCIELDWHTTCVANAVFYGLYNIFQAHVTRDNFIERVRNTNDWSAHFFINKTKSF